MAPRRIPPTGAELDRWTRYRYLHAAAVVEVVAEVGSSPTVPGQMRVVRVYKGDLPVGTSMVVRSISGASCGHGDFRTGSRGVILIDLPSQPLAFRGYLGDDELARLRALGLIPAR